jgi:hypothetical protein
VVAVAVELDGEATVGPAAVDAAAVGSLIGLRQGEPGLAESVQERALELAERHVHVAVKDRPQLAGALGVRPLRQDGFDLARRRVVEDPGLVAGSCEGIEGEDGCEVDEGAGDGGDRDAAVDGGLDAPPAVGGHPFDPPLRGRGDLGPRRRALEESPQVPRRRHAQHRVVAAGPDRREVPRFDARRPVADAIDAAVLPQQGTEGEPVIDLIPRDARREQLAAGHHAMRRPRELSEYRLYGADFSGHWPY